MSSEQDYDPNGPYMSDPNGPYQDDPNGPYNNEKPYDVGYGKPPAHTRFQKGQSGNPTGRPQGAKTKAKEGSLMSIVQEEAARMVTVNSSEGEITLPMIRALVRNLIQKGGKGDFKSMNKFFDMLERAEKQPDGSPGGSGKPIVYWIGWQSVCGLDLLDDEVEMIRQHRQKKADEEALKPNPSPGPQACLDAINDPKHIDRRRTKDDEENKDAE